MRLQKDDGKFSKKKKKKKKKLKKTNFILFLKTKKK